MVSWRQEKSTSYLFSENAACAKLDAKHGDMYNNLKVNLDDLDNKKKQNIPDYDNISIGVCYVLLTYLIEIYHVSMFFC